MTESKSENQTQSKTTQEEKQAAALPMKVFGTLNWILLAVGILFLILGYFTLTLVDARAENTAGILAPLLILGGYIVLFISMIVRPEK